MGKELADLKDRVARLEKLAGSAGSKTWLAAFGKMKDDEIAKEAARLGAEWRSAENTGR